MYYRLQWVVLIALSVCVGESVALAADPASKVERELDRAWDKFERALDKIRSAVDNYGASEIERATGKNGDVDRLRRAREEASAFARDGTLPSSPDRVKWELSYERAEGALVKAYAKAAAYCTKQGAPTLAESLLDESSIHSASWDLVQWGPNLAASFDESARTVEPGKRWRCDVGDLPTNYRVEVIVRRAVADAEYELVLPTADDRRALRANARLAGRRWQSLATVQGGKLLPNRGFARNAGDASSQTLERQIAITAIGGTIIVESIRIKPLIRQRSAGDLMPENSVWRGRIDHSNRGPITVRLTVRSVTKDTIIMRGSWVGTVHLEFTYEYAGRAMRLVGLRDLSGGKGASRTSVQGEGRVSGNELTSTFSWKVSYGSRKNAPVSGTMELVRVNDE